MTIIEKKEQIARNRRMGFLESNIAKKVANCKEEDKDRLLIELAFYAKKENKKWVLEWLNDVISKNQK